MLILAMKPVAPSSDFVSLAQLETVNTQGAEPKVPLPVIGPQVYVYVSPLAVTLTVNIVLTASSK